jgi:hypothetical protein
MVVLGNDPAHVVVNEPLYELEGLHVNIVSIRGSEENNHQRLGGIDKDPSLYIGGYTRAF